MAARALFPEPFVAQASLQGLLIMSRPGSLLLYFTRVLGQCLGLYGPDLGCCVVYSWPFPDLSGVGQWGTL